MGGEGEGGNPLSRLTLLKPKINATLSVTMLQHKLNLTLHFCLTCSLGWFMETAGARCKWNFCFADEQRGTELAWVLL